MDIKPKTEYGGLPFMRSAEETALRRLAAVLGFLCGRVVINGKSGGFKVVMPDGGLIPSGIDRRIKNGENTTHKGNLAITF
jgi:hypothetical protein